MLTWLVEDPTSVCAVLGIVAVALAVVWYMNQHPRLLYALGAVLGLIVLELVLAFLIDTDGKRIQRALDAMTAGVAARNVNGIFAHVADDFHVAGLDKASFRAKAEGYIQRGEVRRITVWDFEVREISRPERRATVTFKVKGDGPDARGVEFYNCRARFVLEPDDQWRMQGFDLFLPTVDPMRGQPMSLPF